MLTLRMQEGGYNALTILILFCFRPLRLRALFGNADPLGKTYGLAIKLNVKVTGIYEDLPYNSRIQQC